MREITDIKEIQQIELEIFDKIHEFCMKRGLRYSLYGGTMIGAIRHKGFIPWDDDIDLAMPRPDYEIFCREFKTDGFSVHTHENDKDYVGPYAKVYHDKTTLMEKSYTVWKGSTCTKCTWKESVYIDVFPLDGVPDNNKSLRKLISVRKFWWRLVSAKVCCFGKMPPWKKIMYLFAKWLLWWCSCRALLRCLDASSKRFGYEGNPFVADVTWGYGECQCIPAEGFETVVDVEFEGRKVKAMAGWDTYLRNVFGDYMKLPPKEKQVSHHHFRAWWKN